MTVIIIQVQVVHVKISIEVLPPFPSSHTRLLHPPHLLLSPLVPISSPNFAISSSSNVFLLSSSFPSFFSHNVTIPAPPYPHS